MPNHRSHIAIALILSSWSSSALADETEAGVPSPDPQTAQGPTLDDSYPLLPEYTPDAPVRRRRPYREGMTVPEGYYIEETPNHGLIAAGASITASLWVASLVSAIALDSQPDGTDDPNFDDMYWPMFVPVAGPFVTIATADSSGTGAAILALDGAFQAAGLAMFIAGFLVTDKELVPEESDIVIAPAISPELNGVVLSGRM